MADSTLRSISLPPPSGKFTGMVLEDVNRKLELMFNKWTAAFELKITEIIASKVAAAELKMNVVQNIDLKVCSESLKNTAMEIERLVDIFTEFKGETDDNIKKLMAEVSRSNSVRPQNNERPRKKRKLNDPTERTSSSSYSSSSSSNILNNSSGGSSSSSSSLSSSSDETKTNKVKDESEYESECEEEDTISEYKTEDDSDDEDYVMEVSDRRSTASTYAFRHTSSSATVEFLKNKDWINVRMSGRNLILYNNEVDHHCILYIRFLGKDSVKPMVPLLIKMHTNVSKDILKTHTCDRFVMVNFICSSAHQNNKNAAEVLMNVMRHFKLLPEKFAYCFINANDDNPKLLAKKDSRLVKAFGEIMLKEPSLTS